MRLTFEVGKLPEPAGVEVSAPEQYDASGANAVVADPYEPGERPLPFGFQPEEDKR